jgi:hypothetical protein
MIMNKDVKKGQVGVTVDELKQGMEVGANYKKAMLSYKKSIDKYKIGVDDALKQMKVDRMADSTEYYRKRFEAAYKKVELLGRLGTLDDKALDKFNKAREDYYGTMKKQASYQTVPSMGQTQAIRAGTQEAQALLSKSVYASTYKVDKDILHSTKNIYNKTASVASILKEISNNTRNSGFTLITE